MDLQARHDLASGIALNNFMFHRGPFCIQAQARCHASLRDSLTNRYSDDPLDLQTFVCIIMI